MSLVGLHYSRFCRCFVNRASSCSDTYPPQKPAKSGYPQANPRSRAKVDGKTGKLNFSLDRKKLRKIRRREGRYLRLSQLGQSHGDCSAPKALKSK
jgi:hypothetical protein